MLIDKTADTGGLVKRTDYMSKIIEIKNKIPEINSLVNKTNFDTQLT